MSSTEKIINDAWENKDQVSKSSEGSSINAINQIILNLSINYPAT